MTESSVVVIDSVTPDLNGCMLDSDYFVACNGSHLIDSHEEKGILQIGKENLMLPTDNAHVPVWTGEGYVFKSSFKPSFGRLSVNENVLGVTKLASDADVTVTVVVISDVGVEKVSGGLTYTGRAADNILSNYKTGSRGIAL